MSYIKQAVAYQDECDHDWKWVVDWYGDPNVINGTADCSGWVCQKCGSTDCEDDPPDDEPDPDDLRDREIDRHELDPGDRSGAFRND